MKLLRLVFAWFVMAGLVIGPIVAPSAALATAGSAMSTMGDMACCPDGDGKTAPQPGKCPDCATMLMCASHSMPSVVPIATGISPSSQLVAELLRPGIVVPPIDIGSSPPAKPPRS